jgi:hypothetical protein
MIAGILAGLWLNWTIIYCQGRDTMPIPPDGNECKYGSNHAVTHRYDNG